MKNLCKASDSIDKKYVMAVLEPKYICKRCGRVAKDDDNLCKGEKISRVLKNV